MKSVKFLTLLLAFQLSSAFALPLAKIDSLNFRPGPFYKDFLVNYNFEGIVKLSNCSGSLIQFEEQGNDAKAIVLTNGHCVSKGPFGGFISPGEVLTNKKVNVKMKVFKNREKLFPITAVKIVYATMTDTDIALYELNETYEQILARTGVTPLVLSLEKPAEGTSIDIVSGYWERGYSCAIDGFVTRLLEAGWTFKNSIRFTPGCDTVPGTSGSPIIAANSREVIAINNTSNESGERCTMDNPCEVSESGDVTFSKGLRYGQQTYNIYSCLNENREVSVTTAGCKLPK
ncbi:MAG: serine protease [Bacteriovoracaceae bacterium]